jgi:hypothetical protein
LTPLTCSGWRWSRPGGLGAARGRRPGGPIRDIAEVIGRHLNLPLVSIPPEQAGKHFSRLAHFLAADSPAASALTRELLVWQQAQPGLLDDTNEGHYFDRAPASS